MGVIIGMDPHKRSATIEVIDPSGRRLAAGRFGTDKAGYADLLAAGRGYPERVWAVEGCNGIGKHIAHRLVHDGEVVVDVPPKLSAQVRVFATGNGRKTDPVDARSVALAALYAPADPGLRKVVLEQLRAIPESLPLGERLDPERVQAAVVIPARGDVDVVTERSSRACRLARCAGGFRLR